MDRCSLVRGFNVSYDKNNKKILRFALKFSEVSGTHWAVWKAGLCLPDNLAPYNRRANHFSSFLFFTSLQPEKNSKTELLSRSRRSLQGILRNEHRPSFPSREGKTGQQLKIAVSCQRTNWRCGCCLSLFKVPAKQIFLLASLASKVVGLAFSFGESEKWKLCKCD